MNEALRRWREKHRDRLAAIQRAYYARHRQEIALRDKRRKHELYRREKNVIDGRNRRWREQNPDHFQYLLNRYRARKLGAGGCHTYAEWLVLVERYNSTCAYCGQRSERLTRDHVVPISKGGTDDIENIVPACKSCNSQKWASLKTPNAPEGGDAHSMMNVGQP